MISGRLASSSSSPDSDGPMSLGSFGARPESYRICGVEMGSHPIASSHFKDQLRRIASSADLCFVTDRSNRALGLGCAVTEGQIRKVYVGTAYEEHADAAVLVCRLCLTFSAFGHNCTDAEQIIQDICSNMKLPSVVVTFELRRCLFSIAGLPPHILNLSRGIHADKLAAVTKLATFLSSAQVLPSTSVCSTLIDQILEEPDPYGKWFQIFAFQGLCMCAAICAFSGSYEDFLAAGLCAPAISLTLRISTRLKTLQRLEGVLIPTMLGLVVPIVWRYIIPTDPCHVVSWYLACLLVFLPGSQLVYGAYEVEGGSIVTGGGRLIGAIVRCMFLALGMSLGWQVFGHNAATPYIHKRGAIASIPPREACEPGPNDIPWLIVFGLYNFPMLFFCLVGLNCRIRAMLGPFGVAYLSLLAYISLREWNELPPTIVNIITVFLSGCLGAIYEYVTGTPKQVALIPVVLILAPGAGAVRDTLGGLHRSVYDDGPNSHMWDGLVLESGSYAFGLYLAQAIWRPLIRKRSRSWAREAESSPDLDVTNGNEFTQRI